MNKFPIVKKTLPYIESFLHKIIFKATEEELSKDDLETIEEIRYCLDLHKERIINLQEEKEEPKEILMFVKSPTFCTGSDNMKYGDYIKNYGGKIEGFLCLGNDYLIKEEKCK